MNLKDTIKNINTKTFTLKCGYCSELIIKNSLPELNDALTYNKELNCKVCKDCNREMSIDNVLNNNNESY